MFVVPGNGQALLGMQDIDVLNLINIYIDSIDAEVPKNKECYVDIKIFQWSNNRAKKRGGRCCTNTDSISKSANNSKRSVVKAIPDKSTNYLLPGSHCDTDKWKSAESTQ